MNDNAGNRKCTYVQCQTCGKIFQVPYQVDIDKLYITAECQNCGETTGLNLGDKEEDIYFYYNVNLDSRHYDY